jgi:hypothetical protein
MAYNKKAAIELSIGTVVIIVIAMTMLIMGIVLVRNIFSGATQSVDSLNDKVKGEIANLFSEEGSKIAIKLGSDKTAKIKQGDRLSLAFGASVENPPSTFQNIKYRIQLPGGSGSASCDPEQFKFYFVDFGAGDFTGNPLQTALSPLDDLEGANAFSLLVFDIPDTAPPCEQKVRVVVEDSSAGGAPITSSATFRVQITSKGIFSN